MHSYSKINVDSVKSRNTRNRSEVNRFCTCSALFAAMLHELDLEVLQHMFASTVSYRRIPT